MLMVVGLAKVVSTFIAVPAGKGIANYALADRLVVVVVFPGF
jgi:hypothetical protein